MKRAPLWRRLVLGALLLIAGWLALFGDKTPSGQITAASAVSRLPQRPIHSESPMPERVSGSAGQRRLAALVRRDVLVPAGARRPAVDLFAAASWTAPPVAAPEPPPAEAPPVAPALPFTVLGKKLEAGHWEVYLAKGDQTLIVRQGDVIDGAYRVEKIEPPTLNLVYLPLGQLQNIEMGDFE